MSSWWRCIALLSAVGACAGPTVSRPAWDRGPRADDHLAAAREHGEIAAQQTQWPDTRPGAPGTPELQIAGMRPWYYYWDPGREQARLAAAHRAAADQLLVEYEAACADAPYGHVAVSPLARWAIGGGPVLGGAMFLVDPAAGSPDRLLADMRCHRAWMMLGRTGMDDCPLDVAGIEVVVHATEGALEVLVTARDPRVVPELQRRAAVELEAAAARHR